MIKFKDNSAAVIALVTEAGREAVRETAELIGNEAQRNAPEKTGALKKSKVIEHEKNTSLVGFTAKHAPIVEFGGRYTPARLFLTTAFEQNKGELPKKFKEKIK